MKDFFPLHMNGCTSENNTYKTFLHVTREFHSINPICRNLYALFSHVKKAYTANQNGVKLFSHVDVWPINDSVEAFATQSESCIVYIQIAFQIWWLSLSAPRSNFPAKAEESSRFVSVGCCPYVFVWYQQNKNTSSKSQRDVSLLKKNWFKERAERDWKYWCDRCPRVYRQFSAPSAWIFVFNLCLHNYFNEISCL